MIIIYFLISFPPMVRELVKAFGFENIIFTISVQKMEKWSVYL